MSSQRIKCAAVTMRISKIEWVNFFNYFTGPDFSVIEQSIEGYPNSGIIEHFEPLLDQVKPFIFAKEFYPKSGALENPDPSNWRLDMPFPIMWFEMSEGMLFGGFEGNPETEDIDLTQTDETYGVLISEEHDFYRFVTFERRNGYLTSSAGFIPEETLKSRESESYAINNTIHSIIGTMLKSLRKDAVLGNEKLNERVRVGRGAERRLVKIKDLVHVVPSTKRHSYKSKSAIPQAIDWSHQWEVMGHWRRTMASAKTGLGHTVLKDILGLLLIERVRKISH